MTCFGHYSSDVKIHSRQKRHVHHRGFIRHYDHTYGGHHHGDGDDDDDDEDDEDGYRRSSGRDVAHLSYETEKYCLLYTSPSPRDKRQSRMPSSA